MKCASSRSSEKFEVSRVGLSLSMQRVHKLIWLTLESLNSSKGKYNNLYQEESAISEKFNEIF